MTYKYLISNHKKIKILFNITEVTSATKKLKDNKSLGCDNVQTELIRYSPDIIRQCIADILNRVAETGKHPEKIK